MSKEPTSGGAWPMRRVLWTRHEAPDFLQIPRERWRAAMATVPRHLRMLSINGLGTTMDEISALAGLAMDATIPDSPSDRAREAVRDRPQLAPAPAADHFRSANRQVNFRLTEDEYTDLAAAAQLIGTTPTQLAGQLTRNGVRRVLSEADREV